MKKIRLLPRIEEAIIRSTGEWVSFPSICSRPNSSRAYNSDFLGILEVKKIIDNDDVYLIISGPTEKCCVNKDHCYEISLFDEEIKKILKI